MDKYIQATQELKHLFRDSSNIEIVVTTTPEGADRFSKELIEWYDKHGFIIPTNIMPDGKLPEGAKFTSLLLPIGIKITVNGSSTK